MPIFIFEHFGQALGHIILPIAILLSFGFANKQYYYICGKCHNCCLKCFENTAIAKIKRIMNKNRNKNRNKNNKDANKMLKTQLQLQNNYEIMK